MSKIMKKIICLLFTYFYLWSKRINREESVFNGVILLFFWWLMLVGGMFLLFSCVLPIYIHYSFSFIWFIILSMIISFLLFQQIYFHILRDKKYIKIIEIYKLKYSNIKAILLIIFPLLIIYFDFWLMCTAP